MRILDTTPLLTFCGRERAAHTKKMAYFAKPRSKKYANLSRKSAKIGIGREDGLSKRFSLPNRCFLSLVSKNYLGLQFV
jgi:hypothetical protein